MWAIFKKELKSYFLSPIGYIAIGVFLFVFSLFFYLISLTQGIVDLGVFFYYTALWGLIIITPILTMKMFAGERKTGTEQLILTSPVNMTGVIFGKLLAAFVVILITLLISFMYFIIVNFFGSPNLKVFLVNILGFILMSLATLSIGMFASSLTENQVVAVLITSAFLILPLFLQDLSSIFSNFALINFYVKFMRGVISLSDVVALVSYAAMFTSFTVIIMQRRKLV